MFLIPFRQYLGTPITCKSGYDGYGSMSNNYCLSHIFTVSHSPVDRVGIDVAHPGVRPTTPDKKYVDYYQWVCFCLLFQVLLSDQCIKNVPVGASELKISCFFLENYNRPTDQLNQPTNQLTDHQTDRVFIGIYTSKIGKQIAID